MAQHAFGGDWTEEKLSRLKKYLQAYTTVFTQNEKARFLTTTYVDAFAGTGSRFDPDDQSPSTLSLFSELEDAPSVSTYYQGSVRIALEVEPPFDNYLFIEKRQNYANELMQVLDEYPDRSSRTRVEVGNSNTILQSWCSAMNWRRNRAVVFLDPYGMSVDWQTVQVLGQAGGAEKSGAIDLWILVPIGQAVNRLLTSDRMPPEAWANRLTTFFGTDGWLNAFYRTKSTMTLFGEVEDFEKQANFESIGDFFIKRLKTAFPHVAEHSLVLLNSRNTPLFILCFATSNRTAFTIAEAILKR